MSSTKEKILATSLRLLNEDGLANVSQRDICQAMGISPGNLTYHFKKKADIIEALYLQLVHKTDESMAMMMPADNLLLLLHRTLSSIVAYFYEYRFIFNDFLHVMRDHEGIRSHYQRLLQLRRQQFGMMLEALQAQGVIRPAAFPQEYDRFYLRQAVLADFWFGHAVFHPEDYSVSQCIAMLIESIYPYLTAEGQAAYWEIARKPEQM